MTPLSEQCWDTDIQAALFSLTRDAVKDQAYWFATVSRVEEGYDPASGQKITLSGLEAWVARCKTPPTATEEVLIDADYKARRVSPTDRRIPNPRTNRNQRPEHLVHQHHRR